jgi:hypothetical protein
MNYEMQRVTKKEVMAYLNSPGGTEENHENPVITVDGPT